LFRDAYSKHKSESVGRKVDIFHVEPGGTFSNQSTLKRSTKVTDNHGIIFYRGADKSLARPGRKQATATEDIDFHISYL